jgi:hypothetical protein
VSTSSTPAKEWALTSRVESDSSLSFLPYVAEAAFNAYDRQHEVTCLPDTRVDLLQEMYDWADGNDERFIFWLNGLAGTGKTTVARTVARKYFNQGQLGASFFFSKGGGDVGRADKFVTTIAKQLANGIPGFRQAVSQAISEQNDIISHGLSDQWRHLILRPLSQLPNSSCSLPFIFVIDALDECDDDGNIEKIVQLLAQVKSVEKVQLRLLLTSRPEIPIRHGFHQMSEQKHRDFVLHNISQSTVDHDIFIFLKHNLGLIGEKRFRNNDWPGEEKVNILVERASGLFIWAATAHRFIREGGKGLVIKNRLSTILQISRSTAKLTKMEEHLNSIYLTVLMDSIPAQLSDDEKEETLGMLRIILGSIVAMLSHLSAYSLSRLLNIDEEVIHDTLDDIHAILDIPVDKTGSIRLHHPSFRDFLLDRERCGDSNLHVNEKEAHKRLAESCVQLMSTSLEENVCKIQVPGTLVTEVERSQVEQCLPPEVQYACLYWIQHLQRSDYLLQDNDPVHMFLKVHVLHWLEALGWMLKISDGIKAVISLESVALVSLVV